MTTGNIQRPVARRKVFYIPGYDPIPPRRYRELYRTEGAEQAEISGYKIGLQAKSDSADYGWKVAAQMDGQSTFADIDVLVWSDIVRDSMSNTIPATYLQLLRTSWTYIVTGTLRRLMWMRKGPVIAALYPVGMLLAQLLAAVVAGWIVSAIAGWIGGLIGPLVASGFTALGASETTAATAQGVVAWAVYVLQWAAFLGVTWFGLRWFKAKDGKLFAYYLMHDYAYSARRGGANPPELEARMATFGDRIAAALAEDWDEVLVVGHSSGAHLGISIVADLIRTDRVPANGPALAFLTLGHVVPMVSFLPKAHRLRNDLAYLSMQRDITWVDVTAPGDGCAFALCDPVAVTGVAPPGQVWPLVISAAFTQTLSEERWTALRWRFFRLHFQYLCAFDRPGDYDYFRITAGPLTLSERFEGRPPSKSRIDVPASKYTSLAA